MRLTQWTDYALRVLMYCAACHGRAQPVTISEVAEKHGISRSHLTKIVQQLAALGSGAAQAGRARALEAGPIAGDVLPGLPAGWQVELDAPLAIQANGAWSDSHGRVRGPDGHEQPFQVLAPFCRTRRSGDAP